MTKDEQIKQLKKALRKAIFDLSRVDKTYIKVDPVENITGSVGEYKWNSQVKEWAKLCDLNLEHYDPSLYG